MSFQFISTMWSYIFDKDKMLAGDTFSYTRRFFQNSDYILDVGSGKCGVASMINKNMGIKVVCIDIDQYKNKVGIKNIIFDGMHIPFKNDVFTIVLCCYVLHHTHYQKNLLHEMSRVTKSKIIIFEDVSNIITDKILVSLHKMTSRFRFNSVNMKFRKSCDWCQLFRSIGLIIQHEEIIRRNRDILYPVSRRMYVLLKGGAREYDS